MSFCFIKNDKKGFFLTRITPLTFGDVSVQKIIGPDEQEFSAIRQKTKSSNHFFSLD